MGNQLVEVLKMHDIVTPEQVVAAPKISCPPHPPRAVLSEPQMAEQLVDVPTVVSPFLLFIGQNADIPVFGARGVPGYGGPQGFLPDQNSRPSDEQAVDIPVPGRGGSGSGGLVPGGGPHDFSPDRGLAAPSAVSREEAFQGVFNLFPGPKKVRVGARVRGRSSSSTLSSLSSNGPWSSRGCL